MAPKRPPPIVLDAEIIDDEREASALPPSVFGSYKPRVTEAIDGSEEVAESIRSLAPEQAAHIKQIAQSVRAATETAEEVSRGVTKVAKALGVNLNIPRYIIGRK